MTAETEGFIPDDALEALLGMGDRLTASLRKNPEGAHATDDEWAWLLTLSASTVHLIRNLREARTDRDALAAKVADVWDEGEADGESNMLQSIKARRKTNPHRAVLTKGTTT